MMRVKVISKLNKRLWPSTKNQPLPYPLLPNDTLEVVEEVKGEAVAAGNNVWYKTDQNFYVWSGGVNEISESNRDGYHDYRELIKINSPLPKHMGDGIRVAVLDTGIFSKHPDFENEPILFSDLITPANKEPTDKIGHGTHVTGLIGARSSDKIGVRGVAPKCKLEVYKVIKDNEVTRGDKINEVLDSFLTDPPQIINLSLSISQVEYEMLENTIEKLFNKGVVMVAAAGNDSDLATDIKRPAISPRIISVGAASNEAFKEVKAQGFHNRLDFFFHNTEVVSTFPKPEFYKPMNNCSMYTAIVSGLLASFISSDRPSAQNTFDKCKNFLSSAAFSHKNVHELQNITLYDTKK